MRRAATCAAGRLARLARQLGARAASTAAAARKAPPPAAGASRALLRLLAASEHHASRSAERLPSQAQRQQPLLPPLWTAPSLSELCGLRPHPVIRGGNPPGTWLLPVRPSVPEVAETLPRGEPAGERWVMSSTKKKRKTKMNKHKLKKRRKRDRYNKRLN